MLRQSAGLTVAIALLTSPAAARADDDYELSGGDMDRGGTVQLEIDVPPVLQDLVSKAGSSSESTWAPVPRLDYVDDQTVLDLGEVGPLHCRSTEWLPVDEGEDQQSVIDTYLTDYEWAVGTAFYPFLGGDPATPCPTETVDQLPPAVVEEAVRRAVIESVPRPEPSIPPGRALTGLPAYLVTQHELSFGPISQTVDLGVASPTVTMSGTATTTVDWGDGTVTEHHVAGTPYPDGEVSHIYTDRGTVDVRLVDRWTVSYDIGGGVVIGTLEATLDPITLDAFPVREYRAVRVSSGRS